MVSNPPYLSRYDLERLQPEVAFEPRIALDGGEDGLDFYRRISREAGQYLNSGGRLLLEVGIGQSGAVSDLLKQNGFAGIQLKKDYQGIERVVTARKSS
jgi:release factor glutamine methyltransferase